MEIFKEFVFDSAHSLPFVPEGHKCKNLHGHTFILRIYVKGKVDQTIGWVIDFADIKKICKPIIDSLDHKYLNEIEGLENPTSEVLALWLWKKIKPQLPQLSKIEVKETPTSGVVYCGEDE